MVSDSAPDAKTQGNKCGHDPTAPRWFEPPPRHANRPGILRALIRRVRDYYARPAEVLPSLNAANESERQQRSERREACCAILGAILHYTDLVTLRVGIPQPDGSMAGLTSATLAELSGLGERRAERAIADLKTAGIITVHPLCKRLEDATYQGLAAIRTVSKHLFGALGLDQWLAHERRKATERRDKRQEKQRRKALANARMAMSPAREPDSRRPQRSAEPAAEGSGELTAAARFLAEARAKLGRGPP